MSHSTPSHYTPFHSMPFHSGYKKEIEEQAPLIHCITNHITILDCANMALCLGAKPIMAEHPKEAAQITAAAAAAVYNLGSITDKRMEAILISGRAALQKKIPTVLDVAGAGCSDLRLAFALTCIKTISPTIIKGNASEIKALAGLESHGKGIDVGAADAVCEKNLCSAIHLTCETAKALGCILVLTGAYDLISDGSATYVVENGCREMCLVTGTGCMLGVVLAAFAGVRTQAAKVQPSLLEKLSYATAMFGICGEEAMAGYGPGTGRIRLMDQVKAITDADIIKKAKVRKYEAPTRKMRNDDYEDF